MLDSLVRVSRRAGICHFANDLRGERNVSLPPDGEHPWFYPEGTPLEPAQTHASLLAKVVKPSQPRCLQRPPLTPSEDL